MDAGKSARRTDRGIGIPGQRDPDLRARHSGANLRRPARDGGCYILGQSDQTIQAGSVQHYGLRTGALYQRREFESQRGQIAGAV